MNHSIRVLGLTGGIASGKSTVAQMFAALGAAVVSADELSREVVAPGMPALAEVAAAFGREILNDDGGLDREKLGRQVFADAQARRRLESILHPAIRRLSEEKLARLRNSSAPLIVYEAPLLFEAGAEGRVDAVLTVCVDADEQLQRLSERDGFSADEARARVAAQMPQAEKAERSEYVMQNSGSLEALRAQVSALFEELTAARR